MNLTGWPDAKLAARIQLCRAVMASQGLGGEQAELFREMLREASRRIGSWLDGPEVKSDAGDQMLER